MGTTVVYVARKRRARTVIVHDLVLIAGGLLIMAAPLLALAAYQWRGHRR